MKIGEVEKLTGVSQGALRLWELRYGWPRPRRISGERIYNKNDIELIKRIHTLANAGAYLGDLLKNGRPNLPPLSTRIFKQIQKPHFESKSSNDVATDIEKSNDPIKCAGCLVVLTDRKDREILLKYANELADYKAKTV